MDVFLDPAYFLPVLFFIIAFTYSTVGLGGGSSYTALMLIIGMNTLTIPFLSLILNLFATTISSFNYIRHKHAKLKLLLPFIITSMPMAYLGGALNLPKNTFYLILFFSLLFIVIRLYLWKTTKLNLNLNKKNKIIVSLIAGSIFGFIAGTVGVGGGIYLVPIIIILGLGSPKEAAACGVIFIWLNSASGLISRMQYNAIDLSQYIPLIVAVVLGGTLGSHIGATRLSPKVMEKILGVIVLVAVIVLAKKLIGIYF